MSRLDAVRRALFDRRADLAAELGRLVEPPAEGAAVSFGKRIGDGTTEAVERLSTTAAARSISDSLADIDRALAKIDDGTYGRCDECGREIGAQRLEALPAASRCVDCAGRA
ncbi:MAG TPA: TraR/DksA C4-type zinc finger protein [Acidimicrobiia bacterium]|nr:TraR/DksA C4-type zinc finger protein [Acidimicrobiia bacterium]